MESVIGEGEQVVATDPIYQMEDTLRSKRGSDIVLEVEDLVKQGFREVTLLGQNVDACGRYALLMCTSLPTNATAARTVH